MIKTHFNKSIDDPLLYDAVFNTDSEPFEAIAGAIVVLVKDRLARRAGPLEPASTRV